jgi:hypothetical protein
MHRLLRPRNLSLSFAVLALAAASLATTAVFQAAGPGIDLSPIGNADQAIEILQGSQNILWSSLSGSVVSYRVEGWPVSIDHNDLAGGLVIERPENGSAGVIGFAEKPRSLSFEIDG